MTLTLCGSYRRMQYLNSFLHLSFLFCPGQVLVAAYPDPVPLFHLQELDLVNAIPHLPGWGQALFSIRDLQVMIYAGAGALRVGSSYIFRCECMGSGLQAAPHLPHPIPCEGPCSPPFCCPMALYSKPRHFSGPGALLQRSPEGLRDPSSIHFPVSVAKVFPHPQVTLRLFN